MSKHDSKAEFKWGVWWSGMRNLQAIMLKMGYVRPGQGIRKGNPVSLPVSCKIGKILSCNQRFMIWESYALLKSYIYIYIHTHIYTYIVIVILKFLYKKTKTSCGICKFV